MAKKTLIHAPGYSQKDIDQIVSSGNPEEMEQFIDDLYETEVDEPSIFGVVMLYAIGHNDLANEKLSILREIEHKKEK